MASFIHDDVFDTALNYIKNNCTKLTVCTAQPTTYTEGNATYSIGEITVDSSDFTLGNGDTSGRKVTVASQSGIPVTDDDTVIFIALLDVTNTKLLAVAPCEARLLANGDNTMTPAFDIEINDPS